MASAYFSGSLVEAWGPRGVFALTAVFPLIVSLAAALIDEQPVAAPKLKAAPDAHSAPRPHPEAETWLSELALRMQGLSFQDMLGQDSMRGTASPCTWRL